MYKFYCKKIEISTVEAVREKKGYTNCIKVTFKIVQQTDKEFVLSDNQSIYIPLNTKLCLSPFMVGRWYKATFKENKKSVYPPKTLGGIKEVIYQIIKNSRNGITMKDLKIKTHLEYRQITNVIYKLFRDGLIKKPQRGLYVVEDGD